MASDLQSFLMKTTVVRNTKSVQATLLDGSVVEVDIAQIPQQEIVRIQSRNTKSYPPVEGTPMATTGMDNTGFCVGLCEAGIISPDLRNAELMGHYNVTTVEGLLYKLFTLNSIADIANEIIELSLENPKEVTSATDPAKVKEAKN